MVESKKNVIITLDEYESMKKELQELRYRREEVQHSRMCMALALILLLVIVITEAVIWIGR